jgi:DNA-binding CsgD family transcriptional regulator
VQHWLREQQKRLTQQDAVPPPLSPLIVERADKRLTLRLVTAPERDKHLLLLEEERTRLTPAAFMSLGLTRREAEVLFFVTRGKTNAAVASLLGTSVFTVRTQLEKVYRKLNVQTRTAAVQQALTRLGILK